MHKIWFAVLGLIFASPLSQAVIGGRETSGFPEVVRLEAGQKKVCTGTIVGPRVILSAAHCATNDSPFFVYRGQRYPVRYVVSGQRGMGHDLALAITERRIAGASFARLGQGLKHGAKILMAGFGCTKKGGVPGLLHVGENRVIGIDQDHMLAAGPHGSVLCEGDSGGPAFLSDGTQRVLVGVSSLSDVQRININVRMDSVLSLSFLKETAKLNDLEICGINKDCSPL